MFDQSTVRGRLLAAAVRLAAERPWSEVTLGDITETANATLVDLRREFSSKGEIVAAFTRAVDDEILSRAPKLDTSQPRRDALFDVVMSRFDALAPYKAAVKSIYASAAATDPAVIRALVASQSWMLQAAGIRTDGFEGGVKVAGLASVYASAFRTWLDDDDPGLARTMAALDRKLRRGERALGTIDEVLRTAARAAAVIMPGRSKADGSSAGPSTGGDA